MVRVRICEPLAVLFPNNIWFKAHFLIIVLNGGNYSLRLRALLSFFIDSPKCSNLWCLFWDELPPSHPVSSLIPPSVSHSAPVRKHLQGCRKSRGYFFLLFLMRSRCRVFISVSRESIIWPTLPQGWGSPPHTSGSALMRVTGSFYVRHMCVGGAAALIRTLLRRHYGTFPRSPSHFLPCRLHSVCPLRERLSPTSTSPYSLTPPGVLVSAPDF